MFQEIIFCSKLALSFKVLHVVFLAYKWFLRPGKDLKKYGEWAIVTGCTSGIGRAFTFALAKKGLNVLLLSRNEESLIALEEELKAKFTSSKFDHLAVDFGKFDAAARAKVADKVKALDVGVLINNVGLSYPFTKYFHELKDEEIAGINDINVNATTFMTRIVLGDVDGELPPNPTSGMIKKKKGAIVNISSAVARIDGPMLAEYSASKAYVHMFSQGLATELAPKGIHVQCQFPFFVVSNMSKVKKPKFDTPSPDAYVSAAMRFIGYETIISPYWVHALQLWILNSLPQFLQSKLILGLHQGIRAKGYKKMKRELEESKKGK